MRKKYAEKAVIQNSTIQAAAKEIHQHYDNAYLAVDLNGDIDCQGFLSGSDVRISKNIIVLMNTHQQTEEALIYTIESILLNKGFAVEE